MTMLDAQTTVGDWVRQHPSRSRVFEQLKIDYCCGGKLPLREACAKRGLDVQIVLEQLHHADAQEAQRDAEIVDADAMTLTELADHIIETHHAYLRAELPRLDQMTKKVAAVHGDNEPRLEQLRAAFIALRDEVSEHILKEERILFPIIRQLEAGEQAAFHCGSVANPIRQMEAEHDNAGEAMSVMSDASDGYEPPEWACNTYRAMLQGLAQLERDMHQHVHKENNVLFPKAIELEQQRLQETA